MSRFDYDDDGDPAITWEMIQWNLKRHLASPKGQSKLREFRDALVAMPVHRLIDGDLASHGDVCAIGAFAAYKRTQQGSDWQTAVQAIHDEYQPDTLPGGPWSVDALETMDVGVRECGLTRTLAWQLAWQNDESFDHQTPERRWQAMYDWTCKHIRDEVAA